MEGKKRFAKCIQDYVEDGDEFWTAGRLYEFHKRRDGTYKVRTNYDSWGAVGYRFLCDCFEDYFEVVWE